VIPGHVVDKDGHGVTVRSVSGGGGAGLYWSTKLGRASSRRLVGVVAADVRPLPE
jgi:hypothetical protein